MESDQIKVPRVAMWIENDLLKGSHKKLQQLPQPCKDWKLVVLIMGYLNVAIQT